MEKFFLNIEIFLRSLSGFQANEQNSSAMPGTLSGMLCGPPTRVPQSS
jgi:hypothetical protein